MSTLSRRSLLKGAVAGGASLLTFDQLFGYSRLAAQSSGDDPQLILDLAATSELFACTHYYTVLTEGDVALTTGEAEIIAGFLDAELYHLEVLYENAADTLTSEFYMPINLYTDREQFSDITEFIETTFVAAYLAATRRLAELGQPLLAATTAQVVGIEQEHLALIRQIGGKRPNNLSFSRPLFYNVSEAASALQPFLEGAANYTGPRPFPGIDAIRDLIRDQGVMPVATFNNPTEFAPADVIASSLSCTVTPGGNYNCNLRSGPGLNFSIVERLSPESNLIVDAQSPDNDGYTWLRATSGDRWVRADIVRFIDQCGTLPTV